MTLMMWMRAFVGALLLTGCGIGGSLLPEQATHAYVGKVCTRAPRAVAANEYVVRMDFMGGEWGRNSGICFHHADARIMGREIQLNVFTSLCSRESTRDFSFRVKGWTAEEYDLVYVDPDGTRHALGKLRR